MNEAPWTYAATQWTQAQVSGPVNAMMMLGLCFLTLWGMSTAAGSRLSAAWLYRAGLAALGLVGALFVIRALRPGLGAGSFNGGAAFHVAPRLFSPQPFGEGAQAWRGFFTALLIIGGVIALLIASERRRAGAAAVLIVIAFEGLLLFPARSLGAWEHPSIFFPLGLFAADTGALGLSATIAIVIFATVFGYRLSRKLARSAMTDQERTPNERDAPVWLGREEFGLLIAMYLLSLFSPVFPPLLIALVSLGAALALALTNSTIAQFVPRPRPQTATAMTSEEPEPTDQERVLDMVGTGKITPEEGALLLDAMDDDEPTDPRASGRAKRGG